MITKQQVVDELMKTSELSEEMKNLIHKELGTYSDQMSKEDLVKFDQFLLGVQQSELATGQELVDLADAAEALIEQTVQSDEEVAHTALKSMRDQLGNLQTMAA